jgi:phospholipase A1
MGYGDVTGIYQWGRQQFSVTARANAGNYSSADTWSFPIQGRLKGYVKITTGYGETLIDYNWKQNTIGAGILLVDWL